MISSLTIAFRSASGLHKLVHHIFGHGVRAHANAFALQIGETLDARLRRRLNAETTLFGRGAQRNPREVQTNAARHERRGNHDIGHRTVDFTRSECRGKLLCALERNDFDLDIVIAIEAFLLGNPERQRVLGLHGADFHQSSFRRGALLRRAARKRDRRKRGNRSKPDETATRHCALARNVDDVFHETHLPSLMRCGELLPFKQHMQ